MRLYFFFIETDPPKVQILLCSDERAKALQERYQYRYLAYRVTCQYVLHDAEHLFTRLQTRYNKQRIVGDWFLISNDLLSDIAALVKDDSHKILTS